MTPRKPSPSSEKAAEQPGGITALLTSLATVAEQAMRFNAGEEWRSVLTTALHELELVDIEDDDHRRLL